MLTLFSEQANKSLKDFLSLNAGAVEKFSQQQTELLTGLISDHINYASSLGKQRDYKEWVNVSQAYTESVRTRMLKSVNASYSMLTETNEQATKLLKKDVEKVEPKKAAAKPASKPTAKAAPKAAPKPAAKPATKAAPAPAPKAQAKPAAKPKTTRTKAAAPAPKAEATAEPAAVEAPAKAPAKTKAASPKPKTSTATRKTAATKAPKAAE